MKKRKLLSQSPVRESRVCYSPRFNRIYYFESSLERDYFNWLIFQNEVTDIECQPERFSVPYNGKTRLYTPDFRVVRGEKIEFIEVKTYKHSQKPEFLSKVKRLKKYFAAQGVVFRVVTEKDIHRGQRAVNYQLLRQTRQVELSASDKKAVKDLFLDSTALSINQFLQNATQAGILKCIALRAIAHGVVCSDLTLPFDQLIISKQ